MGFQQGESEGLATPRSGGDADADDQSAMALVRLEGDNRPWKLEAWSKSPDQLREEAKAMNAAGFSGVVAASTRHSDSPASAALRNF
jgi:hypothetical protein